MVNSTLYSPPLPSGGRFINLTGQVFFHQTVIAYAGQDKNSASLWWCKCVCKKLHKVRGATLKAKRPVISCGCVGRRQQGSAISTHGETGKAVRGKRGRASKEYEIYIAAKGRCENPNNKDYPHYGGRGIEFRFNSIEEMLSAIGRRPSPEYSLDRINNDGHYEVGNVRWATRSQQGKNTRNARLLTINGITKNVIDWANGDPRKAGTIGLRLLKNWCHDCAVNLPSHKGKPGCRHR